jgi:hypothetical protein
MCVLFASRFLPQGFCDAEVFIKQSLLFQPESCIIAVGVYFVGKTG